LIQINLVPYGKAKVSFLDVVFSFNLLYAMVILTHIKTDPVLILKFVR
jgi:hypothetical protein